MAKPPRNPGTFEERLKDEIRSQLLRNKKIDSNDIDVVVRKDVVMLTGTVPTEEARRHAEELVRVIPGVFEIHNHLEVQEPVPPQLSDRQIETAIRTLLSESPALHIELREIIVNNGKVMIFGSTGSYHEKLAAEELIAKIDGVKDVDNRIKVAPVREPAGV